MLRYQPPGRRINKEQNYPRTQYINRIFPSRRLSIFISLESAFSAPSFQSPSCWFYHLSFNRFLYLVPVVISLFAIRALFVPRRRLSFYLARFHSWLDIKVNICPPRTFSVATAMFSDFAHENCAGLTDLFGKRALPGAQLRPKASPFDVNERQYWNINARAAHYATTAWKSRSFG